MPEPLREVIGKACPLEADDVDTDQIFPAQFLKVIERRGLERYLFYRLRYAGKNFGIGSSRENAVWALSDYGIRCVIASSFGDIFYTNASKNGLLCVRLSNQEVRDLRERAASANLTLSVDLASQTISDGKTTLAFEVEPYIKERLLKGMDDVAFTLENYEAEIREYERRIPRFVIPRGVT